MRAEEVAGSPRETVSLGVGYRLRVRLLLGLLGRGSQAGVQAGGSGG